MEKALGIIIFGNGLLSKDLKDTRQIFGLHIMIMLKDVRLLI